MFNKAIIVHGMPSKKGYYHPDRDSQSNSHWLPWLQHQLLLRDILTQTPEMPRPYEPVYSDWKRILSQFEIDEKTALIGHSCGAGFLIRFLTEEEVKIDTLCLVAPWLDPQKTLKTGFFNFELGDKFISYARRTLVFYSEDDDNDGLDSVAQILALDKAHQIEVFRFKTYGHFTFGDMKTRAFPQLLEALLAK